MTVETSKTKAYKVRTRDQHYQEPGPKRILALDGGGLRGILALAMLKQVEVILKARHGGKDSFRLSHYFDLIAGTSTGSVIAAGLATGMTVDEIMLEYSRLGKKVFQKTWLRDGYLRAGYDSQPLADELQRMFGIETTMADDMLQTGLLVVTKRLDSGSTWPISNNPKGRYFKTNENRGIVGNGEYPVWNVVRASSAAPTFFQSERIEIAKGSDTTDPVVGDFIDGGVSPHNNPALQALMYTTLEGYNVNWEKGADKLLLVSMGTGSDVVSREIKKLEMATGVEALKSLMDDNASLMETLLQWMSSSPTAKEIDRELGNLDGDNLGPTEVMSYLRYNVPLNQEYLNSQVHTDLTSEQARDVATLDSPENMPILQIIGNEVGKKIIRAEHFPAVFDLPPA